MPPPLLNMRGITKTYPGVRALGGVDLTLTGGEVLALVGENGAGKSTLMKILGGAQSPDEGSVEIDGRPTTLGSPADARRRGVAVMYQELNLVPALSARENIFLGRERTTAGFVRHGEEEREARELLGRLGMNFSPELLCRRLSIAEQQTVEIAKALGENARILVMDEPTAALAPPEVERLLAILAQLKRQGIGIVYISHRLDEIFRVADRVMVLRDGQHVATSPVGELNRQRLIEQMVGRQLEAEFPPRCVPIGEPRLVVQHLSRPPRVRDVSFDVRRGEVVGLAGLVGAGRTETARLIFGADRLSQGSVELDGRPLRLKHPRQAIAAGIGLLTEDRKHQGLVLGRSVLENFGLTSLARFSRFGWLRERAQRATFAGYTTELGIKTPHDRQLIRYLSGGNQQKVLLARWLAARCEVLIFDEPTRGVDVGAKYEIYRLINRLAAEGKAIMMISSELPELLGMADRILVMHEGRLTGEIADVRNATQEQIMALAVR